jgi:hypothetical protein
MSQITPEQEQRMHDRMRQQIPASIHQIAVNSSSQFDPARCNDYVDGQSDVSMIGLIQPNPPSNALDVLRAEAANSGGHELMTQEGLMLHAELVTRFYFVFKQSAIVVKLKDHPVLNVANRYLDLTVLTETGDAGQEKVQAYLEADACSTVSHQVEALAARLRRQLGWVDDDDLRVGIQKAVEDVFN